MATKVMTADEKNSYKKTIFGYTPKWTVFSNLHPLARLSMILIFNIPFLMANPVINICFMILVIALYRIAKVPKAYYIKFMPFGVTLTFFLFLTYAFFPSIYITPPYKTALITIGAFTYYFENLIVSIAMWLRWMPAVFGALFVFAITDEKDINIALKTVKVPFFLRLVIATGLRCFFSFYYDAMQILEAQKARGLDFLSMNLVRRLKYYIAILVPLVMIEMQKADSMSDAADSRGYVPFDEGSDDRVERTEYIGRDVVMKGKDKVLVVGSVLSFIIFVVLNILPATSPIMVWVPSSMSELISLW